MTGNGKLDASGERTESLLILCSLFWWVVIVGPKRAGEQGWEGAIRPLARGICFKEEGAENLGEIFIWSRLLFPTYYSFFSSLVTDP